MSPDGLRVFISSTKTDLEEYRQAAIEVCNTLNLIPIAMEFFPAIGKGPIDGSKIKLKEADVYVGIFAYRYGFIESGQKKSVTEFEFDYAGERGIERLCFIVDPKYPWFPDSIEFDRHEEMKSLKAKANKHIRNLFTTVDNFKFNLTKSLSEWINRWEEEHGEKVKPLKLIEIKIVKASTAGYVMGEKDVPISEVTEEEFNELSNTLDRINELEKTLISSGPYLLNELLKNYRRYQITWAKDEPVVEEVSEDILRLYNQDSVIVNIRTIKQNAQFIELSGPSGIGKTHILRSICSEVDLTRISIPDAKYGRGETIYLCGTAHNDWERIMADFIESIGAKYQPGRDVTRQLTVALMNEIQKGKSSQVYFMVDEIDRIKYDSVLEKLLGEDGPIGKRVREGIVLAGDISLLLIIAGRRPRLSGLKLVNKQSRFHQMQIEPLNYEHVKRILYDNLPNALKTNELAINGMAKEIYRLTKGHPGAIMLILNGLEDQVYAIAPSDFDKEFRLDILKMVQKNIIGDMKLKEYLLLNVLSVFRRFHFNLIPRLLHHKLLPNDLLEIDKPEIDDFRRWLDGLCESPALIRKLSDNPHHPYLVNPFIRHVLTMDLEVMSREQLADLHQHAFGIYNEELIRKDIHGIRLNLSHVPRHFYTIEALYHKVNYFLNSPYDHFNIEYFLQLCKTYQRLFDESCGEARDSIAINPVGLKDTWENDLELKELILRLPNGTRLLDQIDEIFQTMN